MKIENIIKYHTCCGCGTCAGICPNNAIEMKINERGFYEPCIDEEKCIHCNNCDKVCPQINKISDFSKLNEFVFGKTPDKVIGNYINCYTGHSMDENLRFEASSGGMVTQILISALEEGIIDGVMMTRMKEYNPLEPEPFIARTKEEIISAMGSKYCPVPANIRLKEIINSKDKGKFAIVGLPCHILGVRKAEMLIPKLKEKIVLYCGIFCGWGSKSFLGTDYLLKKHKIRKEDIIDLKYRGKGWPGYLQIKTKDNPENIILSRYDHCYEYPIFGMFFKNKACLSCSGYSNELADISFGDAWGIEKNDSVGTSVIITRTNFTDGLLNKLYSEKKIRIKKLDIDQFISSKKTITFKKTLPIKNTRIFYINTWLSECLYSIPFLNSLSTHPNYLLRCGFLGAFNFVILIMHKIGRILKWFIRK
ncbi:FeS-binding protein [Candidatus Atribacteria bacterium HGW-Atribacteria-1]|nr:MAG: FeS-binding protein [Candidatus Atribacteria bacterium HGW-Atribacteria-1]